MKKNETSFRRRINSDLITNVLRIIIRTSNNNFILIVSVTCFTCVLLLACLQFDMSHNSEESTTTAVTQQHILFDNDLNNRTSLSTNSDNGKIVSVELKDNDKKKSKNKNSHRREDKRFFRAIDIEAMLYGVSSDIDMHNISTSQGKAFHWIVELDKRKLDVTSDYLIQRYILAVLYYSTNNNDNNNSWDNKLSWLSSIHECHWYKRTLKYDKIGVQSCNDEMQITSLNLGKI